MSAAWQSTNDMYENKMLQTFCDPDLLQLAEVLEKFCGWQANTRQSESMKPHYDPSIW